MININDSVGDNFDAFGSVVNVTGGFLGRNFKASDGSEVNISGGAFGFNFRAGPDTVVNISGGQLANNVAAETGSVVNISGGTLGNNFNAEAGSEVNISGGTLSTGFDALTGSVVNISGGILGNGFGAEPGSEVNIFGTEFFISGSAVDGLQPDQAFTITDRDVTLFGFFANGQQFSFNLNAVNTSSFIDHFSPDSVLTVTLVTPPVLGDVNMDGVVDFFDIQPFISVLSSRTFQAEADIDGNGVVDFFDIQPFIGLLNQ